MRQELGHWESDLAVGKQNKAAFVVSVERKSRLLRISKVKDQTARSASRAIIRQLKSLPSKSRKSISYDHGHENVRHEKVNAALGTESFFCEPYHSWEKGSVENSIGLIRRYYPDRSDLSPLTARAVRSLQEKLNTRPRKILGYSTPQEVFDAECVALDC